VIKKNNLSSYFALPRSMLNALKRFSSLDLKFKDEKAEKEYDVVARQNIMVDFQVFLSLIHLAQINPRSQYW